VTPEAQARIARRIEALVQSASPLRDVAIALSALPLYADLGGAICIRPDGTFVSTFWDTGIARPVDHPWHVMALLAGVRAAA
jgi:hypothetical protein